MAASRQSPTRVRAERALFTRLFDDAAVFPPGNAPLDAALSAHRSLRAGPHADLVGPLLVPAASIGDLTALVGDADPIQVAVVARPGIAAAHVVAAVETAAGTPVQVVGLEVGSDSGWADLLGLGIPLTVEVPRSDAGRAQVVTELAAAISGPTPIQAKLRTGATPTWPWPDETEVAGFIRDAVDHDLGFKLTGGLHHVVRGQYAAGSADEQQHGLLNVLAAVRWALNGEEAPGLAALLAERDQDTIVASVERMSSADAAITRAFFTAYGCCGVTDPIGELIALDLLEDSPG